MIPGVFLRWAGGKRRLAPELLKSAPPSFRRYHEPFVGSGVLFFALQPQKAFLSDANPDLIATYRAIQEDVDGLIQALKKLPRTEKSYIAIRDQDRLADWHDASDLDRAIRFLVINRLGFNGLYRVNKSGYCNVPFGKNDKKDVVRETVLRTASETLKGVSIACQDYKAAIRKAKAGDFVYIDPPYLPENGKQTTHTAYTGDGFTLDDHESLMKMLDKLHHKGVYWLLSNHVSDWLWERAKDYHIRTVSVSRSISCRGDTRGSIKEMLIANYPL